MVLPGTPELVPGDTLRDRCLLPAPHHLPPQNTSVLCCQVPALGDTLNSELPPCQTCGTLLGQCHPHAHAASAVLAVPNDATAPGSECAKLVIRHLVRLIPNQR